MKNNKVDVFGTQCRPIYTGNALLQDYRLYSIMPNLKLTIASVSGYSRHIAGGNPPGNSKFPRKSGSVNFQLGLEIKE